MLLLLDPGSSQACFFKGLSGWGWGFRGSRNNIFCLGSSPVFDHFLDAAFHWLCWLLPFLEITEITAPGRRRSLQATTESCTKLSVPCTYSLSLLAPPWCSERFWGAPEGRLGTGVGLVRSMACFDFLRHPAAHRDRSIEAQISTSGLKKTWPFSGHVRPRQGTEICNFGAPSPLEALHWIFFFFSSIIMCNLVRRAP